MTLFVPRKKDPRKPIKDPFHFYRITTLHDDTGVGGNTGPKLSSLLTDGAGNGGTLHLTLGVDDLEKANVSRVRIVEMLPTSLALRFLHPCNSLHPSPSLILPMQNRHAQAVVQMWYSVATYDTGVVLEVEEDTIEALPGLGLADDDGGVDLLAELRLALLDGGHDHVADTTSGETVETSTDTLDGDDVKVTGTGVVRAVHDGTAVKVAMLAIDSSLCGRACSCVS